MRVPHVFRLASAAVGVWMVLAFAGASAGAATLTVTNTNDGLAGSLRQAVQDANAGDTIVFNIPTTDAHYASATATWTVSLTSGSLTLSRDVTIDGGGQRIVIARTVGNAAPYFGVVNITAGNVRLAGLTITGGVSRPTVNNSAVGSGIYNAGTLTLDRCTLTGNGLSAAPGQGGGALYNAGTAVLVNSTFSGNNTDTNAAGINNTGDLTLTNCTVAGNAGTGTAGGIWNKSGTTRVGSSVVATNTGNFCNSGFAGCGQDVIGAFVSNGYNFIGNPDGSSGFAGPGSHDQVGVPGTPANPKLGALAYNGGPTKTMLPQSDSTLIDQGASAEAFDQRGFRRPVDYPAIANPAGGNASDIGAVEADLAQTGPNFTVTTADEHSDGFCGIGDCTLWDAANAANANADVSVITFAPGVTGTITTKIQSTGIQLVAPVAITGPGARVLAVSGAQVSRVFQVASGISATISGLTVRDGITGSDGGGIFNGGQLTVTDCAFIGNKATGANSVGGAIASQATQGVTAARCTFVLNQATARGGAMANSAGNLTATNCTFNQNTAGIGGGVYSATASASNAAALVNCTVVGNSATTSTAGTGGGGIYNGASSVFRLANTIVAGNTSASTGPDAFGGFQSQGYNLVGNATGSMGFGAGGDQVGSAGASIDPKVGALANNGGSTDTMALLPGSPAINTGNDANAPSTDERGLARVGKSDIGAFEFQAPAITLANVSTRLRVELGENVLIGGFIVTGTQPKKVLIRALGPSTGVNGALLDPKLDLYSGQTLLESNDNWTDSPNKQAIMDTTIPPSDNRESAIVRTLPAGSAGYTAIVSGVNSSTGVGLVEVYDLDRNVDSKLANISTRGLVQTGEGVMIGGFIVLGQGTQKVLVRGIGPSLPVGNKLGDPFLELHDGNGALLQANDNWKSDQRAEIEATTIPPANDLESALVRSLPPGNYTAVLRSADGAGTGVALVEVYALP